MVKNTRKEKLCAVLSIFLAFASALLSINWWLPKGVWINFDYESSAHIEYQIFYCENNISWKDSAYVKEKITKGKGKAHIFLPSEHIDRLRIDVGIKPGVVTLSHLQLEGVRSVNINTNPAKWRTVNVLSLKQVDGKMRIESNHADPYLIYKENVDLKGKRGNVLWFHLFIAVMVPVYIMQIVLKPYFISVGGNEKKLSAKKSTKYENIEFLRVLFTLGVVIFHFSLTIFNYRTFGASCVEFFFLLSGYFLAVTYRPDRSVVQFAWQRWCRFTPLVVVGCMLCGGEWRSFFGVFMLQTTGLAYAHLPNGYAWYIAVLFWCSLFYLGLIKCVNQEKRNFIISIIVFLSCVCVVRLTGDDIWSFMGDILSRAMLRGLACMGMGILLAQYCLRKNSESQCVRIFSAWTVAEVMCLTYVVLGFVSNDLNVTLWIIAPISHVILLYLFISRKGFVSRCFDKSVFPFMAKYCLSIYLTHAAVVLWIIRNRSMLSELKSGVIFLLAIFASILLGCICYHIIEKPCNKFLLSLSKKAAQKNE